MLDLRRSETLEKLQTILLEPAFREEESVLAAYELGTMGAYEALPSLVQATLLPDNALRTAALDSIGLLGLPTVVPDLLPFFKQPDLSLHVHHVGLLTLGELPCPDGLLVLIPSLISSDEPWLRWSAAIALANFDEQFTTYLYPQLLDALLEAHQAQAGSINLFRGLAELAFQRLCRYPSFEAYLGTVVFSATRAAIERLKANPPHPLLNKRIRYEREPATEPTLTVLRRNVQQQPERYTGLDSQRLGRLILE